MAKLPKNLFTTSQAEDAREKQEKTPSQMRNESSKRQVEELAQSNPSSKASNSKDLQAQIEQDRLIIEQRVKNNKRDLASNLWQTEYFCNRLLALSKDYGNTPEPKLYTVFLDDPDELSVKERGSSLYSLEKLLPRIEEAQRKKFGVYVCINDCGSSHRAENLQQIRAIFIDYDYEKVNGPLTNTPPHLVEFPLIPSYVIQTSRGSYHYYWEIADGAKHDRSDEDWALLKRKAKLITKYLIKKGKADEAVNDFSRIMRLPGTYNYKKKGGESRSPKGQLIHFVHILGADGEEPVSLEKNDITEETLRGYNIRTYTIDELYDACKRESDFTAFYDEEKKSFNSNFDIGEVFNRILTGEDWHSSMRDIALHFANYLPNKKDTQYIIYAIREAIPAEIKEAQWQRFERSLNDKELNRCVSSAYKKIEREQEQLDPRIITTKSSFKEISEFKEFPEPFITLEEYPFFQELILPYAERYEERVQRSFLFPTALIEVAWLARGMFPYEHEMHLKPAAFCFCFGEHSQGKSSSISLIMRALVTQFFETFDDLSEDLQRYLNPFIKGKEFTSFSAFQNSLIENHIGYPLVNPEANNLMQKMNDQSSNISNLRDIIIHGFDGSLPLIEKAGKDNTQKPIHPRAIAPVILAAQMSVVRPQFSTELNDQGFAPRFCYFQAERDLRDFEQEIDENFQLDFADTSSVIVDRNMAEKSLLRGASSTSTHTSRYIWPTKVLEKRRWIVQSIARLQNKLVPVILTEKEYLNNVWGYLKAQVREVNNEAFTKFHAKLRQKVFAYSLLFAYADYFEECYNKKLTIGEVVPQVTKKHINSAYKLLSYDIEVTRDYVWENINSHQNLSSKQQAIYRAMKSACAKRERLSIERFRLHSIERARQQLFEEYGFLTIPDIRKELDEFRDMKLDQELEALKREGYVEKTNYDRPRTQLNFRCKQGALGDVYRWNDSNN